MGPGGEQERKTKILTSRDKRCRLLHVKHRLVWERREGD